MPYDACIHWFDDEISRPELVCPTGLDDADSIARIRIGSRLPSPDSRSFAQTENPSITGITTSITINPAADTQTGRAPASRSRLRTPRTLHVPALHGRIIWLTLRHLQPGLMRSCLVSITHVRISTVFSNPLHSTTERTKTVRMTAISDLRGLFPQ